MHSALQLWKASFCDIQTLALYNYAIPQSVRRVCTTAALLPSTNVVPTLPAFQPECFSPRQRIHCMMGTTYVHLKRPRETTKNTQHNSPHTISLLRGPNAQSTCKQTNITSNASLLQQPEKTLQYEPARQALHRREYSTRTACRPKRHSERSLRANDVSPTSDRLSSTLCNTQHLVDSRGRSYHRCMVYPSSHIPMFGKAISQVPSAKKLTVISDA